MGRLARPPALYRAGTSVLRMSRVRAPGFGQGPCARGCGCRPHKKEDRNRLGTLARAFGLGTPPNAGTVFPTSIGRRAHGRLSFRKKGLMSKENCEHWDQTAHTYDAEHRSMVGEAFENEIRSWLMRQLTDADNVLELGCGTGIFSAMVVGRVKHLTATDFNPKMLEHATQRLAGHNNVETRREDACHTSFDDNSFSAVLMVNLMHHADAPATVLRECRRVLTPGGRVVVIDCAGHGKSLWSRIKTSLGRLFPRSQPEENHHHHHFSPEDLAALITDAGLAMQETTLLRQRRPAAAYTCLRAVNTD